VGTAQVGIVANPAAARDIRRLSAHGSSVTTNDKVNVLKRVLAGLASVGVERVVSMTDLSGISAGLHAARRRPSAAHWPTIDFLDLPLTRSAADTDAATRAMAVAGVGAIVVVGGDGTNRVVAGQSGATPLVSISTGTNNAFPRAVEPTVAGIAAGLVALDTDRYRSATYRSKQLLVTVGDRVERALVDVAVCTTDGLGAGAVSDPGAISQLFLCFAESDAIGLSAIGGHLRPTDRRSRHGLAVTLGAPAIARIRPPIGPGLVADVDIAAVTRLEVGEPHELAGAGVLAVDGERMIRPGPGDDPVIVLSAEGPTVVDVAAVLSRAATTGALSRTGHTAATP
jgi:predicted polyphosphate/ATP-dependent NAD kinase